MHGLHRNVSFKTHIGIGECDVHAWVNYNDVSMGSRIIKQIK